MKRMSVRTTYTFSLDKKAYKLLVRELDYRIGILETTGGSSKSLHNLHLLRGMLVGQGIAHGIDAWPNDFD